MKIFIITLKNSKRSKAIRRLNELKVKFEIFYGINGKKIKKKDINKIYNSSETKKNIGRDLSLPEIGTSGSHLKLYKKILKEKIDNAIILEDDMYISKNFCEWIKFNKKIKGYEIISFFATPSGLIKKKPHSILKSKNLKIAVHESKTHLYSCAAYQINYKTCKKILKITNSKVCGIPDWPFNFSKERIKLNLTIPFLSTTVDEGFSHLNKDRFNFLKNKNIFVEYLPQSISNFFKGIMYLSYLHFLFNKYPNYYFYDHFFLKFKMKLFNFFTDTYFDLEDIYFSKKFQSTDVLSKYKKNLKLNYNKTPI